MDSITQTVLAGTESVARAIGGAAESRLAKKERARKAWDKLAQNTQGLANWADEKAKEDDLRNLSDVVAASSIGGDYEKAIQALASTPTKTATGAQEKMKAALLLRNEASKKSLDANENALRMKGYEIEAQRNKWAAEDRDADRKRKEESGKALMRARQPMQKTFTTPTGLPLIPGGMSMSYEGRPSPQEVVDRYAEFAGENVDQQLFNTLGTLAAKDTTADDARKAKIELDSREREKIALQERKLEQDAANRAKDLELGYAKLGLDTSKFDWQVERDIGMEMGRNNRLAGILKAQAQRAAGSVEMKLLELAQEAESLGLKAEGMALWQAGSVLRAQLANTFDAENQDRIITDFFEGKNSPIKKFLGLKNAKIEEMKKAIKAAGGNVTEAPVDPKSLSTGDLVKKINEKLGKAGN